MRGVPTAIRKAMARTVVAATVIVPAWRLAGGNDVEITTAAACAQRFAAGGSESWMKQQGGARVSTCENKRRPRKISGLRIPTLE